MTESASPMHQEQASAPQPTGPTCDACQQPFKPRKHWQRFCRKQCHDDWHRWTSPAAVREARELVRQVLDGEAEPKTWNPRARKLLGIK